MLYRLIYSGLFLCSATIIFAQPISFQRIDSIPVTENNQTLVLPWCGGLNFAQFSSVDLNFDGVQDLVVFDREGDRILTFCHNSTPASTDYTPCPDYAQAFPKISGWLLMRDYDQDGKADLFHYWNGSVRVYRQTGDALNGLQFSLVKSQLSSFYTYSMLPLFVSAADIPAIDDIDGDGDLDILTFHFMGGCVEFHKNLSVELYGHSDSLVFKMASDNWGFFREGSSGYDITLNDSCDAPGGSPDGWRHSGSTLLTLDVDMDNDKDLVVGDVDAMHISLLRNDGTASLAHIGAVDFEFPKYHQASIPVSISLFPAAFYLDVNNDGKQDLIVCPNDPENSNTRFGVWRYQNNGANNWPDFTFMETNFLQGEMMDFGLGAYPRWFDYNRDGLMDLVVGNANEWNGFSQLALYQNTGTAQHPVFTLKTRDFAGLSSLQLSHIVPAFADMDADGDMDMIIGESTGYLHYFENIAAVQLNMQALFAAPVMQYQSIKETAFSAPFIADLNDDNLPDIVCGNRKGTLNYYENKGSASSPQFNPLNQNPALPEIANLGGVSVLHPELSNFGHSIPYFFMYQGQWQLAVGSYTGEIAHYYQLHDNNHHLLDDFTLIQPNMGYIDPGTYSSPALFDINQDGFPDLVVGNRAGGLTLYWGGEGFSGLPDDEPTTQSTLAPNPAKETTYIRWPEQTFQCRIYDMAGRTVSTYPSIFQNYTLSLGNFQPGMYIVVLMSANRQIIHKLIVQP